MNPTLKHYRARTRCDCGNVAAYVGSGESMCLRCHALDSSPSMRAANHAERTDHSIDTHSVSLHLQWWKIADSYQLY